MSALMGVHPSNRWKACSPPFGGGLLSVDSVCSCSSRINILYFSLPVLVFTGNQFYAQFAFWATV